MEGRVSLDTDMRRRGIVKLLQAKKPLQQFERKNTTSMALHNSHNATSSNLRSSANNPPPPMNNGNNRMNATLREENRYNRDEAGTQFRLSHLIADKMSCSGEGVLSPTILSNKLTHSKKSSNAAAPHHQASIQFAKIAHSSTNSQQQHPIVKPFLKRSLKTPLVKLATSKQEAPRHSIPIKHAQQ